MEIPINQAGFLSKNEGTDWDHKCCFIIGFLFTLPETNRKSLYLKIDFVGRLSSIFWGRLGLLFSGANLLL